jgi:hypothetical protein
LSSEIHRYSREADVSTEMWEKCGGAGWIQGERIEWRIAVSGTPPNL